MSILMKKKPSKSPPPKKKKPAAKKTEKFSLKRLLMGEEKPDLTELESGSTTILDILSPTAVDTKSRDYIVVDGVFHAYLYVTGYGYATTVGSCWLTPLVEAGEGVNLSFIFKRQPKDKILCPNIMAIRRRSLDSYAGLRDMVARDDSVLADKISRLIIWYSLQKRDLGDEDKNYLDSSLVECYRQYGITFDNATITDEEGAFVEMPIIADWYKVLADNPETKHLSVVLARYVTGSASAMGARNDIDLDNKYIVLDTSGMPDDLLLPGIFWATDIANDLIMDSREDLSALIADELWSLVGANSNPLAAGFVQEMVKTIRGLGGIAVTSTQGMQDLFGLDGGKYGKNTLHLRGYCQEDSAPAA